MTRDTITSYMTHVYTTDNDYQNATRAQQTSHDDTCARLAHAITCAHMFARILPAQDRDAYASLCASQRALYRCADSLRAWGYVRVSYVERACAMLTRGYDAMTDETYHATTHAQIECADAYRDFIDALQRACIVFDGDASFTILDQSPRVRRFYDVSILAGFLI